MTNKIVFHVGYAKSASTTMQTFLFNNHSQVNYLGIYPISENTNVGVDSYDYDSSQNYIHSTLLQKFQHDLVVLDDLKFDRIKEYYRANLPSLFSHEKVNVFSNERMTSTFFAFPSLFSKIERLVSTISKDIKVVFILRNQYSLIESQFRDQPYDPRSLEIGKPVSFNKWVKTCLDINDVYFLNSLDYQKVIHYYEDIIGKSNVGVFLFEELIHNPESFASGLAKFIDIDQRECMSLLKNSHTNKSVSAGFSRLRKIKRKVFGDTNLDRITNSRFGMLLKTSFKKGSKVKLVWEPNLQERVGDIYKAGNRFLSEDRKLNLEQYN